MTDHSLLLSAFLGLIEGLTEFIPVSSTAHLLLAAQLLNFDSAGKTFEIVIQLGAILALITVYAGRLWAVFSTAGTSAQSRRTIASVALAFLPAAVIGVLAYHWIKTVLFNAPIVIAVALILGGIVLIVVDRMELRPRHFDAEKFPMLMSLGIGFMQCLAMIPGVSRSGSSIVGAMLLGADRRSAAEFSFFLSIPTMAGAFTYELYKSWHLLDWTAVNQIVVGFVVAFLAALVVVRRLLDFVSRHGYAVFGWWRIAVGLVTLAALYWG